MKKLKIIFLFCFSILFFSCSDYGKKMQFEKTEVYYTNKVKEADAKKLGNYLVSAGFADDNEKSVQLSKNDENGNYQFRMVTTKEASENETYRTIFKVFAKQISDSVFNKQPVDFHICNTTFKTLKIIPFSDETSK